MEQEKKIQIIRRGRKPQHLNRLHIGTTRYTEVHAQKQYKYNAPHYYRIQNKEGTLILGEVYFQEGPCKEVELNGIFHEDLLVIVIDRLQHFQQSEFACKHNKKALKHLYKTLFWLNKRVVDREKRGVLGHNKK